MEKIKEAPAPPAVLNEKLLLFVLASIQFTHVMDFVIMAPLGPYLKEVFSVETKQTSFLIAVYALSAGTSGFFGTFFIDKFDRRKALLALYIGFIISNFLCAISTAYTALLISRIIAGGFGGILGALVFAIIGDAVPYERRGKATGIVMSAFSLASIIGIPTGLYLAANITWQMPFVMLTVISSIVLVITFFYFPSMQGHMTGRTEEVNQNVGIFNIIKKAFNDAWALTMSILSNVNLRWALLFTITLMLAGFTVVPFLSDYMVNNVGLDKETQVPLIYFFGGMATVVSGPVVGILSDKFGKHKIFMIAAVLSLAPVLIITNLDHAPIPFVFTISTIFFILFGGRFIPAFSMITSSVEPKKRGSFMSINSSVQQLASFIATFGAGLFISNTPTHELVNFNYIGIFSCIATLACIAISFKVSKVS
jgi:predicted MFS family arabinose efflux permease